MEEYVLLIKCYRKKQLSKTEMSAILKHDRPTLLQFTSLEEEMLVKSKYCDIHNQHV